MNLRILASNCAHARPAKHHVMLPLLIMAAFYWLSSLPGTPSAEDPAAYAVFYLVPPTLQNALHVPAYALLATAWQWALRAWLSGSNACAVSALGIAVLYGVLDEWHQSFVPGRFASLTDVLLNAAGAIAGILLLLWASRSVTKDAVR
jgi:hypothetical protein